MGTLGVITEVSLKVLPVALAEATLVFALGPARRAGAAAPLGRPAAADQRFVLGERRHRRPTRPSCCSCACAARWRRWKRPANAWRARPAAPRMDNAQAGPDWDACRDQRLPFFHRAVARCCACGASRCRRPRRCSRCLTRSSSNGRARSAGCGRLRRRPPSCGLRPRAVNGHATLVPRRRRWRARRAPLPEPERRAAKHSSPPAANRSIPPASSIQAGWADPHANPALPRIPGPRRRPRGRGHSAQVRALRFLHRHLPHLPAAGRRARRPARAHLPDEAGARRRRAHAQDADAPGPLPDLPQLRNHLPQRRGLRPPDRHRPQDGGRKGAAPGGRKSRALAAQGRPALAAVRPGHEAGPAGAPAAAGVAAEQGARAPRRRPPGPRAPMRAACCCWRAACSRP